MWLLTVRHEKATIAIQFRSAERRPTLSFDVRFQELLAANKKTEI
jgi:hypothetical protein